MSILLPNQGLLFMKVGIHATESLENIIARKTKEIEEAGFALWGYGGNTCHPATMVQPFVRQQVAKGQRVLLCMQEINSKHNEKPVRADYYSADGKKWEEIPKEINVLGSRYALAIKDLRKEEFILPLNKTQVARGMSQGRIGSKYVAGRVDKACLECTDLVDRPVEPSDSVVEISLVAELCEPYAVFLKN